MRTPAKLRISNTMARQDASVLPGKVIVPGSCRPGGDCEVTWWQRIDQTIVAYNAATTMAAEKITINKGDLHHMLLSVLVISHLLHPVDNLPLKSLRRRGDDHNRRMTGGLKSLRGALND